MYNELMEESRRDIDIGREVLVGGDFNKANEIGTMMTEIFEKESMINVIGQRVDEIPPTRSPGSRVIDHMWENPGMNDRADKIGMVPNGHIF